MSESSETSSMESSPLQILSEPDVLFDIAPNSFVCQPDVSTKKYYRVDCLHFRWPIHESDSDEDAETIPGSALQLTDEEAESPAAPGQASESNSCVSNDAALPAPYIGIERMISEIEGMQEKRREQRRSHKLSKLGLRRFLRHRRKTEERATIVQRISKLHPCLRLSELLSMYRVKRQRDRESDGESGMRNRPSYRTDRWPFDLDFSANILRNGYSDSFFATHLNLPSITLVVSENPPTIAAASDEESSESVIEERLPDSFDINTDESVMISVVSEHSLVTLQSVNTFNRAVIGNQLRQLYLSYQLINAIREAHSAGVTHGSLCSSNIGICPKTLKLTVQGWCERQHCSELNKLDSADERGVPLVEMTEPVRCAVYRWMHGDMDNLSYILELNRLVGRRKGDPENSPFVPWVVDFTSPTEGWRDLTKSKFRLEKGDEQLDFSFLCSDTPHHITESLSNLSFFGYRARLTRKEILQKVVRKSFVPEEYPSTMRGMYKWTPDECIEEWYTDPSIFESRIDELPSIEVPEWCHGSASEFIKWHRSRLESDTVSRSLHHWIDLNFGFKLGGVSGTGLSRPQSELEKYHGSFYTRHLVESLGSSSSSSSADPSGSGKSRQYGCGWKDPSLPEKNVFLQGHPLQTRTNGMVRLFGCPHPRRFDLRSIYAPTADQSLLDCSSFTDPLVFAEDSRSHHSAFLRFCESFLDLHSVYDPPEVLGMRLVDRRELELMGSVHRSSQLARIAAATGLESLMDPSLSLMSDHSESVPLYRQSSDSFSSVRVSIKEESTPIFMFDESLVSLPTPSVSHLPQVPIYPPPLSPVTPIPDVKRGVLTATHSARSRRSTPFAGRSISGMGSISATNTRPHSPVTLDLPQTMRAAKTPPIKVDPIGRPTRASSKVGGVLVTPGRPASTSALTRGNTRFDFRITDEILSKSPDKMDVPDSVFGGAATVGADRSGSVHGSWLYHDLDLFDKAVIIEDKPPGILDEFECAVKADVFGLGCLIAEIFTGRPLFSAKSLKSHLQGSTEILSRLSECPPVIVDVIVAMVHPLPEHRPDLDRVLEWDSLFPSGLSDLMVMLNKTDLVLRKHHFFQSQDPKIDDSKSKRIYARLLEDSASCLKLFVSEMSSSLLVPAIVHLVSLMPIIDRWPDTFGRFWKLFLRMAACLREELCCSLLIDTLILILDRVTYSVGLLQRLSLSVTADDTWLNSLKFEHIEDFVISVMRANNGSFILNHFGQRNFCLFYVTTVRRVLSMQNEDVSVSSVPFARASASKPSVDESTMSVKLAPSSKSANQSSVLKLTDSPSNRERVMTNVFTQAAEFLRKCSSQMSFPLICAAIVSPIMTRLRLTQHLSELEMRVLVQAMDSCPKSILIKAVIPKMLATLEDRSALWSGGGDLVKSAKSYIRAEIEQVSLMCLLGCLEHLMIVWTKKSLDLETMMDQCRNADSVDLSEEVLSFTGIPGGMSPFLSLKHPCRALVACVKLAVTPTVSPFPINVLKKLVSMSLRLIFVMGKKHPFFTEMSDALILLTLALCNRMQDLLSLMDEYTTEDTSQMICHIYFVLCAVSSSKNIDSILDRQKSGLAKLVQQACAHYQSARHVGSDAILSSDELIDLSALEFNLGYLSAPLLDPVTLKANPHSEYYTSDGRHSSEVGARSRARITLDSHLRKSDTLLPGYPTVQSESDVKSIDFAGSADMTLRSSVSDLSSQIGDLAYRPSVDEDLKVPPPMDGSTYVRLVSQKSFVNEKDVWDQEMSEMNEYFSPNHTWNFKTAVKGIHTGAHSSKITTINCKQKSNLFVTGCRRGMIKLWSLEFGEIESVSQYSGHSGIVPRARRSGSFSGMSSSDISRGTVSSYSGSQSQLPAGLAGSITGGSSSTLSGTVSGSRDDAEMDIRRVSDALFLTYTNQIASVSSEVHVWDFVKDRCIHRFRNASQTTLIRRSNSQGNGLASMTSAEQRAAEADGVSSSSLEVFYTRLVAPSWNQLIAGTNNANVHFLDANSGRVVHSWDVSTSKHFVTSLAVRGNRIQLAIGFDNGCIALVDIRNGFVIDFFRELQKSVIQLEWKNDDCWLIALSTDGLYCFDCTQTPRLLFTEYHRRTIEPSAAMSSASLSGSLTPSMEFTDQQEWFECPMLFGDSKVSVSQIEKDASRLQTFTAAHLDGFSRFTDVMNVDHFRPHKFDASNNELRVNSEVKCVSDSVPIPATLAHYAEEYLSPSSSHGIDSTPNPNDQIPFAPVMSAPHLCNGSNNPVLITSLKSTDVSGFAIHKDCLICSVGKRIALKDLPDSAQSRSIIDLHRQRQGQNEAVITDGSSICDDSGSDQNVWIFRELQMSGLKSAEKARKQVFTSLAVMDQFNTMIIGTHKGTLLACG